MSRSRIIITHIHIIRSILSRQPNRLRRRNSKPPKDDLAAEVLH